VLFSSHDAQMVHWYPAQTAHICNKPRFIFISDLATFLVRCVHPPHYGILLYKCICTLSLMRCVHPSSGVGVGGGCIRVDYYSRVDIFQSTSIENYSFSLLSTCSTIFRYTILALTREFHLPQYMKNGTWPVHRKCGDLRGVCKLANNYYSGVGIF
jgi:hypothetical protein